jgi:putative transposase
MSSNTVNLLRGNSAINVVTLSVPAAPSFSSIPTGATYLRSNNKSLRWRSTAVTCPHRKPYPSDLSDEEWVILKPLLPEAKGFGHPVAVDCREILNGIFYLQRSGGQWERMLHDLPPYTTVYGYFQKWPRKGVWQQRHDQLRAQRRQNLGRDESSSVAIADSQSVKTTEKSGCDPAPVPGARERAPSRGRSMVSMVARRLKAVSAIS